MCFYDFGKQLESNSIKKYSSERAVLEFPTRMEFSMIYKLAFFSLTVGISNEKKNPTHHVLLSVII